MDIKPDALSAKILAKYDRNNDGKVEANERSQTHTKGLIFKDTIKHDMSDLFIAADKNHDQTTTREELTEYISTFDKNKDGVISDPITSYIPFVGSEYESLTESHPESVSHNQNASVKKKDVYK